VASSPDWDGWTGPEPERVKAVWAAEFAKRMEDARGVVANGTCRDGLDGTMRCNKVAVGELFSALTQRYGVRFSAGDAMIAQGRVTIAIGPMPVEGAERLLEQALRAEVVREEGVVVLRNVDAFR
jgi:hypothetical protein